MAYQAKPNPYLDASGYPLPGKSAGARMFAQQENERYLASLSPEERTRILARQCNAQLHQNS
ncbi:hypothetical protein GCM10028818_33160 [Spirosoma horti]